MIGKQKRRRRAFRWLVMGFVCVAGLSLCLTSCKIRRIDDVNVGDKADEQTSIKNDAHESKILYYEAQIQSLNTQLDDMEQQMLLMRDDYLMQLQSLKDRLQSKVEESESPAKEDETSKPEDEPQAPVIDKGTGVVGGVILREYVYRLENGCAILTAYQGDDEHVVVPGAVDGYLVVGVDDRTFAGLDVKSVRLPETVERIGWFTFYGCDQLTEVTLPEKLSAIGYASFDGCAPTLCLRVKSGSYAEAFANSFGIPCRQDA